MTKLLDHNALVQLGCLLAAILLPPAAGAESFPPPPPAGAIRIATFNVFELSCKKIDERDAQGNYGNAQLKNAAEILRRVRPQILLVNEIDYHPMENCARLFYERYLRVAGEGLRGLDFPYLVYLPVNTGVPSGLDLNNDGDTQDAEDAWGFGEYPGQYGAEVLGNTIQGNIISGSDLSTYGVAERNENGTDRNAIVGNTISHTSKSATLVYGDGSYVSATVPMTTVQGTAGNDTLLGSAASEIFFGAAGNDTDQRRGR